MCHLLYRIGGKGKCHLVRRLSEGRVHTCDKVDEWKRPFESSIATPMHLDTAAYLKELGVNVFRIAEVS